MLYEIALKILQDEYRLAGRRPNPPEAAVVELARRLERTANAYTIALLYDPSRADYDTTLARRRLTNLWTAKKGGKR